jgi:hypothetical protein
MKIIGIDTGVHTGIAVVENGKLSKVTTTTIARALEMVKALAEDNDAFVVVEDARLRKWYKPMSREQERQILQGVGSVKRDAEVWEDFLQLNNIPHRMQAPKFQSTHPRGVRPIMGLNIIFVAHISIHAPTRGATKIA